MEGECPHEPLRIVWALPGRVLALEGECPHEPKR
jgi:nitrite reductase/ring-hydroxylating ferredoxin subunit